MKPMTSNNIKLYSTMRICCALGGGVLLALLTTYLNMGGATEAVGGMLPQKEKGSVRFGAEINMEILSYATKISTTNLGYPIQWVSRVRISSLLLPDMTEDGRMVPWSQTTWDIDLLGFIANSIFFTLMVIIPCLLIPMLLEKRRYIRRLEGGLCGNCGYDLRGTVSGICPECGNTFPTRAGVAST
jgi:hypothetical protein